MQDIHLYQEILGKSSLEDILKDFLSTLTNPQRTYNYFVGWGKVRKNVEKYKVEIGILSSLVGSRNITKDLNEILLKYPQVLPVFPLIIAVRNPEINVSELDIVKTVSFKKRGHSLLDTKAIEEFCKKTGLINVFSEINNLRDYLLGIEVGLDTNARKNRSGSTMELILEEPLDNMSQQLGVQIFKQKQFKSFEKLGITYPRNLKERKFDFVLTSDNLFINIETNIYGGTGSKPQEIVDAYINRQKDLNNEGWVLIWITDGSGWAGQENQLRKGFEEIDYILNLHFVRKGLLERIIFNLKSRTR